MCVWLCTGALDVEGDTELRGDVILGSKPTDTVRRRPFRLCYSVRPRVNVLDGFCRFLPRRGLLSCSLKCAAAPACELC